MVTRGKQAQAAAPLPRWLFGDFRCFFIGAIDDRVFGPMSRLLGAQDCVESLRKDVIDLQEVLVAVFSRTGPVRFRSWKFPDKDSYDLDLVPLMELYDYMEGETEFNEHSHTVLLELMIDRLLLLLQSFNVYTEQMLGGLRAGDCGKSGGSVCVGPAVKRYWNSLVQFSSQQRRQRLSRLETSPSSSRSSSRSDTHTVPPVSSSSSKGRSVGCQTVESALVPCSACAGVQAALQDSAGAVASLCQAVGLSCSLWSFMQAVEETQQIGRLSACDMILWAREQQRDLRRLHEHVPQVQKKAESLAHTLKKVEKERDTLRTQLEREKESREREREERRRREEESREREREERRRREEKSDRTLQEEKRRRDEELKTVREEQEELRGGAAALEVKICALLEDLELQRETQQRLERERESLVDEVNRFRQEEVRWKEMEDKKRNLEVEVSDTQKRLDKESAKYHSTQRQNEAMVVKQRALLERVDTLVQQCEELQTRLEECEDEKAELNDTHTLITQERNTLQEQFTQQKSEVLSLTEDRERQCVRLQELEVCVSRLTEELQQVQERERILVAFPELNPQHATPQSTGDVLCDMEQQLKANLIRIRVLEQENASLTKTLIRLRHAQTIRFTQPDGGDQTLTPDSGISEVDHRERAKEKQTTAFASSSSSSPSAPHYQTLQLSVVPDAEKMYQKIRQAARARSAGMSRRRR